MNNLISTKSNRQPFLAHCFSLLICRLKKTNKWLCIKETNNRGWWIVGGIVEPGETFQNTAIREASEEAGVSIELKGILRMENSLSGHQMIRMRVIFYAESDNVETKQFSDYQSECAYWLTTDEIFLLSKTKPGLRGPEVLRWPLYIQNGGVINPLSILTDESVPIELDSFKIDKTKNDSFFSFEHKTFDDCNDKKRDEISDIKKRVWKF